jgi:Integrase zinc binding domain/Integrase core domain
MIHELQTGARKWSKEVADKISLAFNECRVIAGRVYFRRDRLVIPPDDEALQLQILYRTHSSAPGGHPGRVRTIDLLNRNYWWPGMTTAARKFCQGCLSCTKSKTPRSSPPGFLKPLPIPVAPWRDISVDYITPLPDCLYRGQKLKHIAVVVDRLTKMRHYIATEGLSAEELAERFIDRVWSLHGTPESIVSDRGSQFVSEFWKALSQRLGTTLRPTSSYHPEGNGQTERINQELETFLRQFVNWNQDDWVYWLPLAEFAGNNAVSSTTGVSPFFANYGFHPRMGVEPANPCPPQLSRAQREEFFKAQEIANRFKAILDQVTALSKQAQDRYEANANKRRSDAPKYQVGDEVMVSTEHMVLGRPVPKLSQRWDGPFKVIEVSSQDVTVRLPGNMKAMHPTFHVKKVFRRKEGFPGQRDADMDLRVNEGRVITRTDEHEEVVEWEFDEILDYGQADNKRWQYYVGWKGHAPTWQPVGDLRGCDDAIWKFHDAHPELPGPPSWVKRRARQLGTRKSPRRA